MQTIVIDTNVLLVANAMAPQMSEPCKMCCIERLSRARENDAVVVDQQYFILGEYPARGMLLSGTSSRIWQIRVEFL